VTHNEFRIFHCGPSSEKDAYTWPKRYNDSQLIVNQYMLKRENS